MRHDTAWNTIKKVNATYYFGYCKGLAGVWGFGPTRVTHLLTGCLQLPEILEIYWNLKTLLEIL